jgi:N,N'-diacetyllegionaminate synthase
VGRRCKIIAEAGVNHNGSIETALELIAAAAEAGADMVKFQTFRADNLVTRGASKTRYQKETTDAGESQLEMLKKLELSPSAHEKLIHHCQELGIDFLSAAFDLESVDLLVELGQTTWKIPSGEITNLPYLRKIGALNHTVILSTGMSYLKEIAEAVHALRAAGTTEKKLTILHCNTEYPAPMSDVNLRALPTLMQSFPNIEIGYSDHTLGIEVPIAAVALGASIIEKHFTLDCRMYGPDHRASLEPDELKVMVEAIRNVEAALGDGVKEPSESERANRKIVRKSIVASCNITAGELFSVHNITAKRPGTGISPMWWDKIIGKAAQRSFIKDELIET